MSTAVLEEAVSTFVVQKELAIAATPAMVWESILDQLGPKSEMPDGKPFPMKFEAWPGGRWYRDLGANAGHLWGHVQVIKPPTLLEICGPMFMSYPAISHVQYRLTEENGGTRLKLVHRAMGQITQEHREGVHEGWDYELKKIREAAESRRGK
jgi:uncharacterized protein YndB with AHSA1/START domain